MSRWKLWVALALIVGACATPQAQGTFWVLVNGSLRYTGNVTVTGSLTTGSLTTGAINASSLQIGTNAAFIITSKGRIRADTGDGNWIFTNNAQTTGITFKIDATPTIGSGFGSGAAVTAGSTPLAGSVGVGTTPGTTGVITFGGTAFPSAPFCITEDATSAVAVTNTPTTTQLTIGGVFVNSDTVTWHCISSK